MTNKIIIAGGGGFGLELWSYVNQDIISGYLPNCELIGLLNDDQDCELLRFNPSIVYKGSIKGYQCQSNEIVLIAVGSVVGRRKIAEQVKANGGKLFTYVHPSVIVAPTASIGNGSVICPNSIVNTGAVVGDNSAINVFCSIGHGAKIGADSVLSPYCALSGDSVLGSGSFMGTRATIFPKVRLGDACVVDAHTAVRQSADSAKIISSRGQYLVVNNRFAPV